MEELKANTTAMDNRKQKAEFQVFDEDGNPQGLVSFEFDANKVDSHMEVYDKAEEAAREQGYDPNRVVLGEELVHNVRYFTADDPLREAGVKVPGFVDLPDQAREAINRKGGEEPGLPDAFSIPEKGNR